ncbi:MAG: restriction endonuclease subunit S [Prevotellaceae bacterium]|jgi:type I restriction enzyme S subunit|nr:restriction endonuclease subunit S [Prevotellaceae bacterium]
MNTKQLRQKILDLAIRGKLVPQDPNDEPASALLERIRANRNVARTSAKTRKIKPDNSDDKSPYRNLPFQAPKGWVWVKIKDVFEINPKNEIADETQVSFIPMTFISEGFANKHIFEIRKWKEVKKGFTHFRNGDVGIAKITPCFENRKSVIFKDLKNNFGAGTTELHILRPKSDEVSNFYLLFFAKTEMFITNGVQQFSGAVGQQRVGKSVIEETYFPLPPLAEQRRIVSVIESAFALIDEIEDGKISLRQIVGQAKAKTLDLAVRGKLAPRPAANCRLKNTKTTADNSPYAFEVPEGWKIVKLENVCNQITDGTHKTPKYTTDGIPFLRVTDITESNDSKKFISEEEHTELIKRCKPEKGNVLLSKNGTIGVAKVVDWEYEFSIFVSLCLLKPKEELNSKYLAYYLGSANALSQMTSRQKTVTITNLHLEEIREIQLPLPPLSEQQLIVARIEAIFARLDAIENELKA